MRPVIILFAKAPVPGKVKTRLTPPLTPEEAAALHHRFTLQMLKMLSAFEPFASIELHTDADCDAWRELPVTKRLQCEGNLGERMLYAMRTAASRPVMILGSDAPSLPAQHVSELLASEADLTLGPTDDGGYYAIVCRCQEIPAGLFEGVAWSTSSTLEDTVLAARACGLSVALGPQWWDVDTAEDLKRL